VITASGPPPRGSVSTVRGALKEVPNEPLVIRADLEVGDPRESEVLVRVSHCGVCHSDLSVQRAAFGPLPAVLGHEAAGVVEACGPATPGFAEGDTVVLSVSPSCGRCVSCIRNRPSLCRESATLFTGAMADGDTRVRRGDQVVYRGAGMGAFAEYVVMSTNAVVKVPPDTPLDLACLVGCGVGTGVGAALNTARVEPGSTVVVLGVGGVGISIVQGARIAGAYRIIVSDPVAERRELASTFGATDAIDPTAQDVAAEVKRMTRYGADYAFDAIGRSEVVNTGIAALRTGGTMVCVGVPLDPAVSYTIDSAMLFTLGEKVLRGCAYGSSNPHRDIPRYLDLWRGGQLDLESMVTARRPLEEVNDALDDLVAGRGLRTVLAL
jgi:S-(hydroxymethyl)glutathione dehydrogenase / alcohol dehydrogenase